WAYACSKAMDEFMALAFHRERGLPVIIVRLFNTVGPRQTGQYGMVIPRFVDAALRGEPLTIFGTGAQSRCFGFVGDVVDALMGLMDAPAAFGNVFNIGSTQEVTIDELARRVLELTGSRSETKYISYEQAYGRPFDDMMRRVPDLSRIQATIGWTPTTSLDDILRSVIDDARRRFSMA
ncbi:MAG: GDP-mannose 4,6-dehydratase, partial [Phycisphaerales bacterium]|nr:GDP-mannose 4,6-dehydratase [Phycisphaerales bacterium]